MNHTTPEECSAPCFDVFVGWRIFWCVVATVLAILCYYVCTLRPDGCFRGRRPSVEERDGDRGEGLGARFDLGSTAGNTGTCTICLDNIGPLQRSVRLECGHLFHAACLLPWVCRSKTCPNCRALTVP